MSLLLVVAFFLSLTLLLPTGIPFLLAEALHGGTFGSPLPLVVTAIASGAFLWLACRRFARMEL